MNNKPSYCLWCKRTSQQVPLIQVEFKGQPYWICPQHLPIMIHKPQQLVGILPGIDTSEGAEHEH